MPRQLQSSIAPFKSGSHVVQHDKGGTGGTTPVEAVEALGGIHRSKINMPNGVVGLDENGKMPVEVFTGTGSDFLGFSIDGPSKLVYGQVAEYRITDLGLHMVPEITVESGSFEINGETLLLTAPETGTHMRVNIGIRRLAIPLINAGIQNPIIILPVENSEVSGTFTIKTRAFDAVPLSYTPWTEIEVPGAITIPAEAIFFEIEGKRSDGEASITYAGEEIHLGISKTNRLVRVGTENTLDANVSGNGSLFIRFVSSSVPHTATDWEVATDDQFADLVFSSYGDTVNLTSITVSLPIGSYYARARFQGSDGVVG